MFKDPIKDYRMEESQIIKFKFPFDLPVSLSLNKNKANAKNNIISLFPHF